MLIMYYELYLSYCNTLKNIATMKYEKYVFSPCRNQACIIIQSFENYASDRITGIYFLPLEVQKAKTENNLLILETEHEAVKSFLT